MDRFSGHQDITEIQLKTALNTIQSFNQTFNQSDAFFHRVTLTRSWVKRYTFSPCPKQQMPDSAKWDTY